MPITLALAASTASITGASSARSIRMRAFEPLQRLVADADDATRGCWLGSRSESDPGAPVGHGVLEAQQARRKARHQVRQPQVSSTANTAASNIGRGNSALRRRATTCGLDVMLVSRFRSSPNIAASVPERTSQS